MKKILAIVQHRKDRSPGQRFRFEQYMSFLQENGFEIIFSNVLNEKSDKIFYSKGKYFSKFIIIIKSFFKRRKDLKIAKTVNCVYIYREAFMLGTIYFERKISKLKIPIIYDFDDAIWLNDTSNANKKFAWLKNSEKTKKICKLANVVITGNNFLADYARQFNNNVIVIPTTLNLEIYETVKIHSLQDKICIGWTGSETTLKHFNHIIPTLNKIKEKYESKIYFKVIASRFYAETDFEIIFSEWSKESEIEELLEFDIGIMPLPDDEWSKGKCGFKGLQCMALKIPVVMSKVGTNIEIIKNGENGFLVEKEDEWINCLSKLIDSEITRKEIGGKGYETVKNKYSFDVWKSKYLQIFKEISL
ncbi:MAG: glycosyltransferase family 4 protein [Bacteroidales bacterium]|jgi:glycosyltransferase involved in cell wall biosynthesis|nr:glycosyltransferase family 4 protein [Bacteroidales bacterium]